MTYINTRIINNTKNTNEFNLLYYDNNTNINNRIINKKKQTYKQETLFSAYITYPILPIYGGTGITTYNIGDLIVATNSTTLSTIKAVEIGYVLTSNGINNIPKYNKIDLETMTSGILPAKNGGTDNSIYSIGDILCANTTLTLTTLSNTSSYNVLLSNGINQMPYYGKINLETCVSGILPISNGGLNFTTCSIGDLLFADSTTSLSKISNTSNNKTLVSQGINTNPIYDIIDLSSAMVSGILQITNGGTGSSLTAGVIYSTGTELNSASFPNDAYSYLLQLNSTSTIPRFVGCNVMLQYASISSSALITCSTVLPNDNTIPLITEGTQIFSLSFTPLLSTSMLYYKLQINIATASGAGVASMSLFSGSSIIGATNCCYNNAKYNSGKLLSINASANTLARTISVRVGPSSGTCYINGITSGTRAFGGTSISTLEIIELLY